MSTPTAHALLSASSAHRWINCPPSARFTEDLPDKTSGYAEEGRLAHAIGELYLHKRFGTGLGPVKFKRELAKLQEDPLYKPEMIRHVETYVDLIDRVTNAYPKLPYVAMEQQVDFSGYVPEGFGTCDCLVIGGTDMHVVDFKYGQGVPVSAEQNPQMMLYALGALARYGMLYNIQQVRLTICQPRKDNESTQWITTQELMTWGESIRPVAQQAWDGKGQMQAGDWCRFCKAKGRCPAQAKAFTALEDFGFQKPELLTNETIADLLIRGRHLAEWVRSIEEYTLTACLNGEAFPGWKAVEGRAIRQFTDQDAAFEAALATGIEEAMLYERRPITLAGLEKIMGKKPFEETLGAFVTTPPGKPTLVPESDNRKPITRTTAQEDFQEVLNHG